MAVDLQVHSHFRILGVYAVKSCNVADGIKLEKKILYEKERERGAKGYCNRMLIFAMHLT